MRTVVGSSCLRLCVQVASLGWFVAGLAGCSSDTSRFGDNAFSNPFASNSSRPEVTGSVASAPRAPVGRVESRPLTAQPLPPPPGGAPTSYAPTGQAGGGPGIASYAPPPAPMAPRAAPVISSPPSTTEVTGSVRQPQLPPPPPRQTAATGWNWDGGTAVIVGPGENLDALSRKYGVPGSAILQANGLANAGALRTGERIVIPRYNHTAAPPVAAAPPKLAPPKLAPPPVAAAPVRPVASAAPYVHVVAPGETLTSIAHKYRKSLVLIASANKIAPHTMVKMGDRLVIPGRVAAAPAVAAVPAAAPAAVMARAPAPVMPQAAPQMAAIPAVSTARVATPAAEATDDESVGSSGGATFRWPVRGRIITGFGAKPNGQQNDGINLAVPEGTAVRASDDGVVAYAGNELKGYGNLILVRHSNGFVTAYAHTSEIMVKRNDQVRRGQVIAKSGQSGSVTTPQLHFEIRKGSSPVDPLQFLPAA
jgi:murein DD-endopeptidase MepM/ murein hydrolase activator NlpD